TACATCKYQELDEHVRKTLHRSLQNLWDRAQLSSTAAGKRSFRFLLQLTRLGEVRIGELLVAHFLVGVPTLPIKPVAVRFERDGLIVMHQGRLKISLGSVSLPKTQVGVPEPAVSLKACLKVGDGSVVIL